MTIPQFTCRNTLQRLREKHDNEVARQEASTQKTESSASDLAHFPLPSDHQNATESVTNPPVSS